MLVLSRKKGQTVVIDEQIEITILEIDGETIKLGISAPQSVQIVRKELLTSVTETNQEAASKSHDLQSLMVNLKKIKNTFQ
ncbi:carbon storage regulator CsrA [Paenibacillus rhizovicinus]|uniref:Translational regulator CsrA n=1 Tax=Paenibacillus rhizovicinus TaxID=2704463 RepID=A0A6C0P2A5_9BACL|nr:carbon storage regulator CsrA [Paenibacillus rhizovicinus]QHW32595.1 carbon storage regulator CsrA [Paenibacillus rhizovicinus]